MKAIKKLLKYLFPTVFCDHDFIATKPVDVYDDVRVESSLLYTEYSYICGKCLKSKKIKL